MENLSFPGRQAREGALELVTVIPRERAHSLDGDRVMERPFLRIVGFLVSCRWSEGVDVDMQKHVFDVSARTDGFVTPLTRTHTTKHTLFRKGKKRTGTSSLVTLEHLNI